MNIIHLTSTVIFAVSLNKCCDALTGGRICLSCDRVVKPRDCNTLTVCGPHEQCSVEQFVSPDGIPWFRVGCRDNVVCSSNIFGRKRQTSTNLQRTIGERKRTYPDLEDDLVVCTSCCNDKDLCNDHGCGVQGIDYNLGTVCYGCPQASGPDTCDKATMCFQDQDCYVGRKRVGFDVVYEMKCLSKSGCKQIPHYVGTCCNTTLCNRQLTAYQQGGGISSNQPTTRTVNVPQQTSTTTPKMTSTATSTTTVKTTVQSTQVSGKTTNATCNKWIDFPQLQSRYCLMTQSGFGWSAAKNLCNRNGMHLPIIDNDAEYHFIESILKQNSANIWLDGTDINQEGVWTWSSTGEVIVQKYWDNSQPDSYLGTEEDCLEMGVAYNFRWNDAECTRLLSVLCEDGFRHHLKALPNCRTGWKKAFNLLYCYEDVHLDWYSSQEFCRTKYDAHLPIVDSKAKQDFLQSAFSFKNLWLDGTEEDHQGHWQWVSTKEWFRMTLWNPGEPNDYAGIKEECLETGPRDGWRWNDAPCSWNNRTDGIVCERTDPSILG